MSRGLIMLVSSLMVLGSACGYQLENGGKIWGLLVAGSSGYDNYRHQADVCHAYQILHKNGIPDENIIVMMYDDIAYNEMNPTRGIIVNQPNGSDVYKGVLKDYTGEAVNSTNFLKVLTGDAKGMRGIGSGRVIKSGPSDHVFVNFVDHGAPGLLAFPRDELYADDLERALRKMAVKRQFARLVFYVEACESGSMFDSLLPDDLNIFVVTAADPHESSYACYYDSQRQTFLGDVFSVMWMQDSEKEDLLQESLHHQYEIVRTETNTSHVEEYGDLDVGSMHVSEFLGYQISHKPKSFKTKLPPVNDAVPSHHVPIAILQHKLEAAVDPKEKQEIKFQLHRTLKYRHHMESIVSDILMLATGRDEDKVQELKVNGYKLSPKQFSCYKKLVSSFSEKCFKLSDNPHAFRQLYILANVCGHEKVSMKSMMNAITKVCSRQPRLRGII
ncbi:Legumain [Cryptotermes secundus]|nr:Legumain [Cryptotermes secundus]